MYLFICSSKYFLRTCNSSPLGYNGEQGRHILCSGPSICSHEQQSLTSAGAVSIKKSGVLWEDIVREPKAEVSREPALRR